MNRHVCFIGIAVARTKYRRYQGNASRPKKVIRSTSFLLLTKKLHSYIGPTERQQRKSGYLVSVSGNYNRPPQMKHLNGSFDDRWGETLSNWAAVTIPPLTFLKNINFTILCEVHEGRSLEAGDRRDLSVKFIKTGYFRKTKLRQIPLPVVQSIHPLVLSYTGI